VEQHKLYSIKEICTLYSISRRLVDTSIHIGTLKALQIDAKQKRLRIGDVEKWLNGLIYKIPQKTAEGAGGLK
jgi:hypothetical protein